MIPADRGLVQRFLGGVLIACQLDMSSQAEDNVSERLELPQPWSGPGSLHLLSCLSYTSYTYVNIYTGLHPLLHGPAISIHLTIATTLSLITHSRRHSRYRAPSANV